MVTFTENLTNMKLVFVVVILLPLIFRHEIRRYFRIRQIKSIIKNQEEEAESLK